MFDSNALDQIANHIGEANLNIERLEAVVDLLIDIRDELGGSAKLFVLTDQLEALVASIKVSTQSAERLALQMAQKLREADAVTADVEILQTSPSSGGAPKDIAAQ